MEAFDRADALVSEIEGYHSTQASDPGGDTYYGVARRWHPKEPWPPTPERAREIRQLEYFNVAGCPGMPWEAAMVVYDMAIQSDPHDAKALAQTIIGVKVDGFWGPTSEKQLRQFVHSRPGAFVVEYQARRIIRYSKNPLWVEDGLGWMRRSVQVTIAAMEQW